MISSAGGGGCGVEKNNPPAMILLLPASSAVVTFLAGINFFYCLLILAAAAKKPHMLKIGLTTATTTTLKPTASAAAAAAGLQHHPRLTLPINQLNGVERIERGKEAEHNNLCMCEPCLNGVSGGCRVVYGVQESTTGFTEEERNLKFRFGIARDKWSGWRASTRQFLFKLHPPVHKSLPDVAAAARVCKYKLVLLPAEEGGNEPSASGGAVLASMHFSRGRKLLPPTAKLLDFR